MLNINNIVQKLFAFAFASIIFCGLVGICPAAIRFEHFALNVESPKKVADWYIKFMGLKIISENKSAIFVGDPDSNFMFELYNKKEAKGKYSDLNHATSHVAFAVDDAEGLANKMVEGGAKLLKKFNNPAGDTVINIRDPWGNMLQVIHRLKPKL